MPTKVLSSKPILQLPLFTVSESQVELPNGVQKTYHDVWRQPSVGVFPLTDENEVYLVKQHRSLLDKSTIEAIAGFIDDGESPQEAAERELREETGMTADRVEHLLTMEMSASVIRITHSLFLARGLSLGHQELDAGEDIEVIKMPLSDVVKMVESGEINTAGTSFGALLIDKMLREGKLS